MLPLHGARWLALHASCSVLLLLIPKVPHLLHLLAGMLFLHGASPPVVHAGLKASNVLVDEHWTAKVSDLDIG